MKDLNIEHLDRISNQLKNYGIDSPDLRAELTDHYAGEIEAQMESGKSFDEAFAKFVEANSWKKLRKLEHQHVEIQAKSFQSFLGYSLREVLIGRKFWITYPLIGFLYCIIGLPEGRGEPLLFLIQSISAGVAVGVIVFMLTKARKIQKQCGPLLSLAMFQLYLSVYLPVTNLVPWSHPVFDGFYLAQEVNTFYYALWIWGIYITWKFYRKMRRKTEIYATAK